MKSPLIAAVSATALSLSLLSTPAFSQEQRLNDSAIAGMIGICLDTSEIGVLTGAQIERIVAE